MLGVLPLAVIRDGHIVDVNDAFVAFLGWSRERLATQPFLDFVAEHDRPRIQERHERRLRGEVVPDSYELDVLHTDGSSRHVEIWIKVEGSSDVVFELADRTHLARRRTHLRELAGLGAAVQREHTEERIFAVLGEGLKGLGMGWARVMPDDDGLVVLDVGTPNFSLERLESEANIKVRGSRGPWREQARQAWTKGSEFLDDLPVTADAFFSGDAGPIARSVARDTALGRGIALRIDVQRKPWQLLFVMADWLLEEDLASFGLLRIQVSAALDAARVIANLSARNDELAALNMIGAVAGAGSELSELFQVTASSMMRLLATKWLSIQYFDEDAQEAVLGYQTGLPQSVLANSARVSLLGSNLGKVARTGKPILTRWEELPSATQERLVEMRFAIVASVPLIAGARVIGAVNTGYEDAAALLPSHLEVLQAAGAHFAAAVQAKRLLDDLRKSYADLAHTQEQLVQRERLAALGELAAIVAHEIRNPLGAVFNAVGAIRQQAHADGDKRLATLLAILEEEATRMNQIVGDLLDFARPVSAALRPERIEPIVTEAVDAATADAALVRVEREVARDLPPVPINGRLLRQAILNVAINAVQALGPAGGTITLRMRRDNGAVRIEIADTGPGIPTEHQARVFEPFFTTRASGTGLGLTVVKRIVDVHHGETSLHTTGGKGTTFVIRLPVAPVS